MQRVAAKRVDQFRIASVTPLSPGGSLRMIDFFAASMTVLFLTFAVLSGVRALQSEVDSRTILRLMASPTEATAILAGKFAALLLIGLTQMSVMIAATSILFGTKWGNPLPVAALVATSVLMAIGLTAFLMSLAKNAEQGTAMAAIVISLLSVVGGQFLPPQGLPDIFETLARLTPNGQASMASSICRRQEVKAASQPSATIAVYGNRWRSRYRVRDVQSALGIAADILKCGRD